jgi:hypothetical protein
MKKLCMIFIINLSNVKFVMNWGWGVQHITYMIKKRYARLEL